jgi:hypothetical protein
MGGTLLRSTQGGCTTLILSYLTATPCWATRLAGWQAPLTIGYLATGQRQRGTVAPIAEMVEKRSNWYGGAWQAMIPVGGANGVKVGRKRDNVACYVHALLNHPTWRQGCP